MRIMLYVLFLAVLFGQRTDKIQQVYFGISTPFSSLSLFTPSITAGLGYSNLQAQLMTVPPYAVAYVVTVAVSWSADHFNAYVNRSIQEARRILTCP